MKAYFNDMGVVRMYEHHRRAIEQYTEKLQKDEEVLAIIVGGSIAHGFATEKSDVDVMIVVSEENYQQRMMNSSITFLEKEFHVDGKYVSVSFMQKVADHGNEATRYAFEGAFITYSKIEGLPELIEKIQMYPVEQKEEKINRFYAQFKAWNWYCKDALRKENPYVLSYAVSNMILFGGRLILAYNETLYPYHKWFLKVLENTEKKPEGLIQSINNLLERKGIEEITEFHNKVDEFAQWNSSNLRWTNIFVNDSEWNWMDGHTPVADL